MSFAFVFPGHGSEMAGMLDSLSSRQEVKDTLQEASDILGKDFNKIICQI
jgi:malonyl CoA-acyl carrier protein transacylase